MYNHNTINLSYNASSQSAQKTYTNLLTIGKKYRVSFDFGIDGITTASFTLSNGNTQVRNKVTTITTKEITEFTATATNLTLLATLSAGNYGRLAHIDNLVIEEIFEVGEGYRFGFNGQEMDNEVAGAGNITTAEYWEYDARLGRRWNIDPLRKPWQSDYLCFSNNPIWKVDPNGDDDYFNAQGVYQYSDKKTTRNIIIVSVVNNKKVQTELMNYAFTKDNAKTLTNIGEYYAKSKGLDVTSLSGKSLSVGNRKWEENKSGQQTPIEQNLFNNGSVSDWTDIMNHNGEKNTISFVLDNGKINPLLNDANNLISTLGHEFDHKRIPGGDGFEHLQVYFNQVNDKSFSNTTKEYQKQIHTNIRELVNEALNYKDKELTKAQIKSVRNEGAKWKSKFEKAGVTFGDKKK